jgi:hypothetical protein
MLGAARSVVGGIGAIRRREIMSKVFKQVGSALLALGVSQVAMAITVYDNGAPNLVSGTGMSEVQVAENFTLGSSFNITNLRFWSIQSAAADYSGSVYWAVYSNSGGQPGSILFSNTTATTGTPTGGSTGFGYGVYAFDIPVSFTLAAGNYWLGLHNGPLANITPREMLWATTAVQVGSFGLYRDGVNWVNSLNEHAFAIDGTVVVIPEPTTTALLLAGVLATIGVARRRVSA